MRPLVVCNFVTVDGRYEDDDHDIVSLFEHQHSDYHGADSFDHYTTALMQDADVLLLSGRRSALDNLSYWAGVETDPDATDIRREFAARMRDIAKVVVSDTITDADLAPYANVRIVRIADARTEVEQLKATDRAVLVLLGRVLWNDLMRAGLVDELHLVTFRSSPARAFPCSTHGRPWHSNCSRPAPGPSRATCSCAGASTRRRQRYPAEELLAASA